MSARHMARVQEILDPTVESAPTTPEEDESEEEEEEVSKPNLFDLLIDEDGAVNDDVEVANDEFPGLPETEEEDKITEEQMQSSGPGINSARKSNSRKKKKNKKKSDLRHETKYEDDEDVEALVRQLECATRGLEGSEDHRETGQKGPPVRPILAADKGYIKAEDELKRIFGGAVVRGEARAGRRGAAGRGGPAAAAGGGRGGGLGRAHRHSHLITPRQHWPPLTTSAGLSMEIVGTKDGIVEFRYTHNYSYLQVQQQYEECVAAHDPNLLARLAQKHPYHVDTLMSLRDIYHQMNQLDTAQELLERALLVLEVAWHPSFSVTLGSGVCLPFKHPENRPMFSALFKHIQDLGRRGCHRSALECCKILLSCDPSDPMGVLCCVDYHALMAEQYLFIPRLIDQFRGGDRSLALHPGMAYSLALAKFRLAESGKSTSQSASSSSRAQAHTAPSPPTMQDAEDTLLEALQIHPGCVPRVIDRLNQQTTAVNIDQAWGKVLNHPHFKEANILSASLDRLTDIFVERHHLLWRPQEVQAWLKQTCVQLIQNLTSGSGSGPKCVAEDWAVVCQEAFPPQDPDQYAHLSVSTFSDTIAVLPPEENPFAVGMEGIPGGGGGGPEQMMPVPMEGAREDLRGVNPVLAFFRTMLPWVEVDGMSEQELETLAQQMLENAEFEEDINHDD